jgi:riboflavin transporter FmnP
MLVIHIKVSFLTLDVKDAVITLCGLYFGPLSALFISVLVPLVELITVSDTGLYGLIMNIISSVAFSVTASLIYKWKKSFYGAILALASAAFVVTGIMMLANLVVTPYFMGVDIATVRGMIPTLLLPFNLLKAIVNVGVVLLLYKHLSTALRKAGFLPRKTFMHSQETGVVVAKPSRWRIICVSIAAVVLITGSLLIIFLVLGGNVNFGK